MTADPQFTLTAGQATASRRTLPAAEKSGTTSLSSGRSAALRSTPQLRRDRDRRGDRPTPCPAADALDVWTSTLGRAFGEGPREAAWVGAMYAAIGLGDDVPWRHYLETLDGEAVATTSLFLGAGVAGVYFVCTAPDVRRRGVSVLGSSPMGHSAYRRLGFQELGRIGIYEWRRGPD
jgi:hypothetical protein